jgi:hypothetical protein
LLPELREEKYSWDMAAKIVLKGNAGTDQLVGCISSTFIIKIGQYFVNLFNEKYDWHWD